MNNLLASTGKVAHMRKGIVTLAAVLLCAQGAFAQTEDSASRAAETAQGSSVIADPIAPVNRAIGSFNKVVDTLVIRPVTIVYKNAVPSQGRQRVTNVLQNLNEPVNMVNSFLQGDIDHGFGSFWRFALNSTFGIAGLFDFAEANAGLKYRREDFGQTLGHYGVGNGFYLVLPLLGPSTLRDTVGLGVDIVSNPFTFIFNDYQSIGRVAATVVDTRVRTLAFTDDVNANSLDPYATYRSSYVQYRNKQVRDIALKSRYQRPSQCH